MKTCMGIVAAGLVIFTTHSLATQIIDVDGSKVELSGETQTVDANRHGSFIDLRKDKYASVTKSDAGTTAAILAQPGRTDFYFKWTVRGNLPSTLYRYAEIHYRVNPSNTGDFIGDPTSNRLRLQAGDDAEEWDDFSNPERIPGSVGSHSFIVDLQADKTYSGTWNTVRWDFFNDARNGGKSITLEKVVFASEIASRAGTTVGFVIW